MFSAIPKIPNIAFGLKTYDGSLQDILLVLFTVCHRVCFSLFFFVASNNHPVASGLYASCRYSLDHPAHLLQCPIRNVGQYFRAADLHAGFSASTIFSKPFLPPPPPPLSPPPIHPRYSHTPLSLTIPATFPPTSVPSASNPSTTPCRSPTPIS